MTDDRVDALECSFERVGVTSERVQEEDLAEAIVASTIEPGVSTTLPGYDVSFSGTGISVDPTPAEVWEARTGITTADFAIASYGSLGLPVDGFGSEFLSVFVDHHIAIVRAMDVIADIPTALGAVEDGHGSAIIATGPSATADMGELVQGAHGPSSLHAIIVMEG